MLGPISPPDIPATQDPSPPRPMRTTSRAGMADPRGGRFHPASGPRFCLRGFVRLHTLDRLEGRTRRDRCPVRLLTREIATRRGVVIAKWLGDGAMLVGDDIGPIIATTGELLARYLGEALALRAGATHGGVLLFEGDDYIGRPVNLAAGSVKPRSRTSSSPVGYPAHVLPGVDGDPRDARHSLAWTRSHPRCPALGSRSRCRATGHAAGTLTGEPGPPPRW